MEKEFVFSEHDCCICSENTNSESTEEHRDTDTTLLTGTIIFECTSIDFCPRKNIIDLFHVT